MQTTLMDYLQCDVPAGMTLGDWRHSHAAPARPRRFARLRRTARR